MRYQVTVTTGREEVFSALVSQAMRLSAERIEIVRLEEVKTTVRPHDRVIGLRAARGNRGGTGPELIRRILSEGPARYSEIKKALAAAGMAPTGTGSILTKMRKAGEVASDGGLWRTLSAVSADG